MTNHTLDSLNADKMGAPSLSVSQAHGIGTIDAMHMGQGLQSLTSIQKSRRYSVRGGLNAVLWVPAQESHRSALVFFHFYAASAVDQQTPRSHQVGSCVQQLILQTSTAAVRARHTFRAKLLLGCLPAD